MTEVRINMLFGPGPRSKRFPLTKNPWGICFNNGGGGKRQTIASKIEAALTALDPSNTESVENTRKVLERLQTIDSATFRAEIGDISKAIGLLFGQTLCKARFETLKEKESPVARECIKLLEKLFPSGVFHAFFAVHYKEPRLGFLDAIILGEVGPVNPKWGDKAKIDLDEAKLILEAISQVPGYHQEKVNQALEVLATYSPPYR